MRSDRPECRLPHLESQRTPTRRSSWRHARRPKADRIAPSSCRSVVETSQRRAVAREYLDFTRMMAVTNDPDATAHHVANRLPAGAENRSVQNVVDLLMRERGIAAVQHDEIGPIALGDCARLLRERLRAAVHGTCPQRNADRRLIAAKNVSSMQMKPLRPLELAELGKRIDERVRIATHAERAAGSHVPFRRKSAIAQV